MTETAKSTASSTAKRVFFVIGEASGDRLGASLARSLKDAHGDKVVFEGLAGEDLQALGVSSLFDIEDIAVMGLGPVVARLPTIFRRLSDTVEAILASKPDLVVLIDSPDFTHRVAKRVRARAPDIPIIGWVSPSVWAWRPGRAKAMAAFVDHLLVLLPFEVEAHRRLGGPPATYVGHPLVDELASLRPESAEERPSLGPGTTPTILVLPGSRGGEISRLMPTLKETMTRVLELMDNVSQPRLIMPTVAKHQANLHARVADWPMPIEVISDPAEKRAAFRSAHAAIAASGTVSLELALSAVPMIIVYRLDWLARQFRSLVQVWTIILPNLVLGRPVVREYVDETARPEALARALVSLATDTPERRAQIEAFGELDALMRGPDEASPAQRARAVVERFLFPGE
jgi:lipid-A-disaccharide synthase